MTDQLRAACIHGDYSSHYLTTPEDAADGPTDTFDGNPCPGGRSLTVGEVVEWIREQDAGLLERLTDAS